jgi:hypothetical protein
MLLNSTSMIQFYTNDILTNGSIIAGGNIASHGNIMAAGGIFPKTNIALNS